MYDPTLEGFKRYKQLENYKEIAKKVKEIALRMVIIHYRS